MESPPQALCLLTRGPMEPLRVFGYILRAGVGTELKNGSQ